MINKLIDKIEYPAFALKDVPFKVSYKDDSIIITRQPHGKEYIFDIMVEDVEKYSERLFKLEEQHPDDRIVFDYSIINREQLVFSYENLEWCVDSSGQIYNLTHKQNLPVECRKVIKLKDKKIWLDKILAPFDLKVPVENSNVDELWATIVNINGEWFLKSFSYEYENYSDYIVI